MNLSRYLREEMIVLEFDPPQETPPENSGSSKWKSRNKERVLDNLVEILERSGKTINRCKLLTDFINREKKATTAIGHQVAIPHVRTLQAKTSVMGFLRNRVGLPFGAPDGQDVRIFIPIVGPPYDDKVYLKIYRQLGELLLEEGVADQLLAVDEPGEVIRIFGSMT